MKILLYSMFFTFGLLSFSSCKKNSDTPAPTPTPVVTPNPKPTNPTNKDLKTSLNKKWVTGNSNSRIAANSSTTDYLSFEFNNDGNYYIIKADLSLISGTFSLNSIDSVVTCFNGNSTTSQYGTLKISEITETKLVFTLLLANSTTPVAISTTASTSSVGTPSNGNTDNTKTIAKSWSLDHRTQGTTTITLTGTALYAHVILTENGTYWTESYDGIKITTANGIWQWSDATQTQICTSATSAAPDCTTSGSSVSFDSNGNMILTHTPAGQPTMTDYYIPLVQ